MTCPAWRELDRSREIGGDDAAWYAALAHLDTCDRCRPVALAADPTLLFRDLRAPEVTDRDVDDMRQRVALLRRARELEAIETPSSRGPWKRRASRVAAILLVAGSLTAVEIHAPESTTSWFVEPAPAQTWPLPPQLASQPVLEEADHPFEQVVEWTHDDLALVVLVDERFDV